MKILISENYGFCFGVNRAVTSTLEAAKTERIACLGDLTHNRGVMADIRAAGVRVINSVDEAESGETVFIRAHGEAKAVYCRLADQGIKFADLTCPVVCSNRQIAIEASKAHHLIIFGDPEHPEIQGILGWIEQDVVVIKDINDIPELDGHRQYYLMSQTTASNDEFEQLAEKLSRVLPKLEVSNTICPDTKSKQKAAAYLAKKVNHMVILGDRSSSNTRKLYDVCAGLQRNTYLFESIDEILLKNFSKDDIIGLTAGASTPPAIIEEAMKLMSEDKKNENLDPIETVEAVPAAPAPAEEGSDGQSFEDMLNESILTLHTGDIVKGTVISIANGEVMVNLGYKSDGVIQRGHYSDKADVDPADELKVGEELEVYVLRVNDGDGNVLLSKKRIDAQKGQLEIEKAFKEGVPLPGKITEVIKGGVIATINGIRVFVPSSQVSNRFIRDLDSVLGQEHNFMILEFDRSKRRIVAGRKELATTEENAKKETAMEGLEEGGQVTGKISRITNFGAFVGLKGIDGLIHISELSWARVRKVEDVVKEGDEVTAWIIKLDKDAGKISLSLKNVNDDPWYNIEAKYPVGAITTGKVVRLADFGAFVELEDGLDGLVHISQISHKRIEHPKEALAVGDEVEVKITGTSSEKKRISLSIKETQGMITDLAYDDEYDDDDYDEDYATYDMGEGDDGVYNEIEGYDYDDEDDYDDTPDEEMTLDADAEQVAEEAAPENEEE